MSRHSTIQRATELNDKYTELMQELGNQNQELTELTQRRLKITQKHQMLNGLPITDINGQVITFKSLKEFFDFFSSQKSSM